MSNQPKDILESLYQSAVKNLHKGAVKTTAVSTKIEAVCRCNTNKAPIRFLMSCLLAKIHKPQVDIRKPYTEIEGEDSYSAHNAADKQTGSIGDVEITLINDNSIVTCYEMKDKRVTKTDVDVALQKLSKTQAKIDNYIFITTDIIEVEVTEYAKSSEGSISRT